MGWLFLFFMCGCSKELADVPIVKVEKQNCQIETIDNPTLLDPSNGELLFAISDTLIPYHDGPSDTLRESIWILDVNTHLASYTFMKDGHQIGRSQFPIFNAFHTIMNHHTDTLPENKYSIHIKSSSSARGSNGFDVVFIYNPSKGVIHHIVGSSRLVNFWFAKKQKHWMGSKLFGRFADHSYYHLDNYSTILDSSFRYRPLGPPNKTVVIKYKIFNHVMDTLSLDTIQGNTF